MDMDFIRCNTCKSLIPKQATRCAMCGSAVDFQKAGSVSDHSNPILSPKEMLEYKKKFRITKIVLNTVLLGMMGFWIVIIIIKLITGKY